MRLLYRDDVTPVNYEPEHFRALRPTDESVDFDVEPHTMRLGQVLYALASEREQTRACVQSCHDTLSQWYHSVMHPWQDSVSRGPLAYQGFAIHVQGRRTVAMLTTVAVVVRHPRGVGIQQCIRFHQAG